MRYLKLMNVYFVERNMSNSRFGFIFRLARKIKLIYLNQVLSPFNQFKLRALGVKMGKHCKFPTSLNVWVAKNALFKSGDYLTISGSDYHTPLCHYRPCVKVEANAQLIVGNHVGMSSPTIWVVKSVIIGNNVNLGGGVYIMDSDAHSLNYLDRRDSFKDRSNRRDKQIVIEDDVLVGMNSIILKGVHIGARSVIGAGSVVTKDIPADCIAAGNPAVVLKKL